MILTQEQQDIISSTCNLRISAVAGSGKTTTVIAYAKARPADSKILYLAFNKSVKLNAQKKFKQEGLHNVQVETAHSLAYKHTDFQNGCSVKASGYKASEIVALLQLHSNGEKHAEFVLANHILKCTAYFCNSDKTKIQEVNYLHTVTDPKAKIFVTTFYRQIIYLSRILLSKMDKGEIEITHDFYLKKFQLSNPELHYDYLLFDEGQDASNVMLHLFLNQKAIKVIVGDVHQQIYAWRFAVNALEKVPYKTSSLSASFRFNQMIADLAMEFLAFKKLQPEMEPFKITGLGNSLLQNTKAVLARTNLGLLIKAIEVTTDNPKMKHIYFEGNINSYTYADDGASLYDVLHLYNGKRRLIRDPLIKTMQNLSDLEAYVKKTEDIQLGMMVEIVKQYGNRIPAIINKLKKLHVPDGERHKAELIFSTVHRCKGMEYDAVELVNDFITIEKLEAFRNNKNADPFLTVKIHEEINLLYVAVTRTQNMLLLPETLAPRNLVETPQITILKIYPDALPPETAGQKAMEKTISNRTEQSRDAETRYDEIRLKHQDAYKPWNEQLDAELKTMKQEGTKVKDLAVHFARTRGAITSRIKKLGLQ